MDAIIEILNANCGDVLKAHVLNAQCGMSINTVSLRAPTGDLERAFADNRARLVEDSPPRSAEKVLEEFRKDVGPPKPTATETLPKMPAGIRFDDVEPVAALEKPEPAPPTLTEGEVEVDGKVYVTQVRAAELRGTSNIKTILATASIKKWARIRSPEDGRLPLYLKDDVLASPTRRGSLSE